MRKFSYVSFFQYCYITDKDNPNSVIVRTFCDKALAPLKVSSDADFNTLNFVEITDSIKSALPEVSRALATVNPSRNEKVPFNFLEYRQIKVKILQAAICIMNKKKLGDDNITVSMILYMLVKAADPAPQSW